MRMVRIVLILAVALLMALPVMAQEKKKGKRGQRGFDVVQLWLRGVTLTDEQKPKVDALKKEYEPKLAEAGKKMDVRTDDQKKAAADAEKAALDAGKSRREAAADARAAVTLSDEQKAKRKEAGAAMQTLMTEMRGKVMDLLTAEQKEQVQKNIDEMKKGFGKKRGEKKDA
jgi:Spy/CpxP family protein refolding chaperone